MILHSFLFDDSADRYIRMARVLEHTAALKSPSTPLTMHRTNDADTDLKVMRRSTNITGNARKTRCWTELLREAPDCEQLLLLDCDTMILRELDWPLGDEYDLGLTTGEHNQFRMNSGVVIARACDDIRDLAKAWYKRCLEMMQEPALHKRWHQTYGGINQSSLGSLLETSHQHVRVKWLQTSEWNALGYDHPRALETARIVHLLSNLRREVTDQIRKRQSAITPLVEMWKQYDLELNPKMRGKLRARQNRK